MSDILVDTSVWLDFFKAKDSPYSKMLDRLLEEGRVCTTHLVKAEIVPGAKTLKQFHRLKDYFDALPLANEPETLWLEIMETQFQLKRRGINGVSIPDLIIVVVAEANGKIIFTKDQDFKHVKRVFPIRLLELPG
jgi:predicted nucleic acid-binding protein